MSALCVACCSTIKTSSPDNFRTSCCKREICAPCLASNPRLRYYNPCLACCGAVQVVASSSAGASVDPRDYSSPMTELKSREQNSFVIGEDVDDDQDREHQAAPPASVGTVEKPEEIDVQGRYEDKKSQKEPESGESGAPSKYYLNKGDTLNGIALRFRVNSREICRLNGLPPSTLTTTPHLLHTRSYIILPKTDKKPPPPPPDFEEREEQRKRERAAKQFQFVTKEVDWNVAKTYVALAVSDLDEGDYAFKRKEAGRPAGSSVPTEGAVERYLDDEEWEREQLRAGVAPRIMPFPFVGSSKA